MNQKLNCILLVDDDELTNFINQAIVAQANCTHKCIAMQSGASALEFLRSGEAIKSQSANLLLLDLNMPLMNGWEFLEEFDKLEDSIKRNISIVVLTSSLNKDDEVKAKSIDVVADFEIKSLTVEKLNNLILKHCQ